MVVQVLTWQGVRAIMLIELADEQDEFTQLSVGSVFKEVWDRCERSQKAVRPSERMTG